MRRYFERIENCRYRPFWRLLARLTGNRFNPTGHGWSGWLNSDLAMPRKAFGDRALMRVIEERMRADLWPAFKGLLASWLARLLRFVTGDSDPQRSASAAKKALRGTLHDPAVD